MYDTVEMKVVAIREYNDFIAKGEMQRLFNRLRNRPNKLLSYEQVAESLHITGQHDLGIQVIRVDQIVGSVGRTHDFDRQFFPLHEASRDRWSNVAKVIYMGKAIPPIDLYKIHDVYFVIDGNHRVSVMRQNGQEFAEAHIIEIDTPDCIDEATGVAINHCEN